MTEAPSEERVGPWVLEGPLGQGGMAVVYAARHVVDGARAAVKRARRVSPRLVAAIRREVATLRRLQHPGVVAVLDHGAEDGQPWYAMPLLEGRTLGALMRESRPASTAPASGPATFAWDDEPAAAPAPAEGTPVPEVIGLLVELCGVLAHVHAAGLVHRDLKPDNVVVVGGRPVLLDFGLAVDLGDDRDDLDRSGDPGGGTLGYMAPEQATGGFVDARADLYALGCMLYEALTGTLPHPDPTTEGLLARLALVQPAPPSALADVAPALDALVLSLLEPDPAARPGQAWQVGLALAAAAGLPRPACPPPPRLPVFRSPLVGRSDAWVAVTRLLDDPTRHPLALRVLGPPGIGRSRFALEVAREARARRWPVIAAGGANLVRAVCDHVLRLLVDRRREDPLPDDAADLGRLAPELAPWCGAVEVPTDPVVARDRAAVSLTAALAWIARGGPVVVVIDDHHRADALAAAWVAFLLRSVPRGPLQARVVLTRPDGGLDVPSVLLLPLARDEVGAMAGAMIGDPAGGRDLATALHGVSGGVPVTLTGLVQALAAHPEGVRIAAERDLPRTLAEMVVRRHEALAAATRAVVGAAAVLGTDASALALALGRDGDEVASALQEALAAGVLVSGADGLALSDADRDAALAALGPDEARRLHAWAAERWEGPPAAALALHLEGAGHPDEAARAWDEVARLASARFATEEALVAAAASTRARPHEARSWLAVAHHARALGRRAEALAAAATCLERATDAELRARAWGLRGWLAVDRDEDREAEAAFTAALDEWSRTDARAEPLHARIDRATIVGTRAPAEALPELDAIGAAACGDPYVEARVMRVRGDIALRAGDTATAIRCYRSTLDYWRSSASWRPLAATLGNLGVAHHRRGEGRLSASCHLENLAVAVRTGYRAGAAVAFGNAGTALHLLGHPDAERVLLTAVALSLEGDGRATASMFLGNLAQITLAAGEIGRARELAGLAADLARGESAFQEGYHSLTCAVAALRDDDLDDAERWLDRATALPGGAGIQPVSAGRLRDLLSRKRGEQVGAEWLDALPGELERTADPEVTEAAELVWEVLGLDALREPLARASKAAWERSGSVPDAERYLLLTGVELPPGEPPPPLPEGVERWLAEPADVLAAVLGRIGR